MKAYFVVSYYTTFDVSTFVYYIFTAQCDDVDTSRCVIISSNILRVFPHNFYRRTSRTAEIDCHDQFAAKL